MSQWVSMPLGEELRRNAAISNVQGAFDVVRCVTRLLLRTATTPRDKTLLGAISQELDRAARSFNEVAGRRASGGGSP